MMTENHDPASASAVVEALEGLWTAIRAQHPEVPEVVMTHASGSARGGLAWGHFAPGRWRLLDGTVRHEVLVSGEGFERQPVEILGTTLHEAAHGLAAVRGVKDTSRQGRYHNKIFKSLAEELGLVIEQSDSDGWTCTSVPPATAERYVGPLERLAAARYAYRLSEAEIGGAKRDGASKNGLVLVCPACTRQLRMSMTSFEVGPVRCVPCACDFEVREDEDEG